MRLTSFMGFKGFRVSGCILGPPCPAEMKHASMMDLVLWVGVKGLGV